jgi:hypothetical protein
MAASISPLVVLFTLMVIGVAAFAYVLMYDLGFRGGVVPGVIRTAEKFSVVAVFLAASYRGQRSSQIRVLAFILAAALAAAGLVMFNKTQVLISLGELIAGLCLAYPVRRVLPLGVASIVLIYFSIGGVVAYGRNTLGDRVVPIAERWALMVEGFGAAGGNDPMATTSSWGRLCYVPSQSAGMDFFDQGMGGRDFALIPWVFVPRLLAPGKPVITESSAVFHEKISGNFGSSTGQGIFSSGYYNGGWLGVLIVALLAGSILAQTSAVARAVMERRAIVFLPMALYGLYMAFRIDGAFLADYVGAFVFLLYPLLLLRMAVLPLAGRVR